MKVVLIENVNYLGIIGDVKEVADGFARNFLLPKRLAVRVGDMAAKILLKNISTKREQTKKEVNDLEKLSHEFEGKVVEFSEKANKTGKLFAAIGSDRIAKELGVDAKQIQCESIKSIGEYKIKINFGHNIKTNINVIVKNK